jgi:transposase
MEACGGAHHWARQFVQMGHEVRLMPAELVPKQTGSGGKVNLHGISKRGDTYLRTVLIHGARSVLSHAKEPGLWIEQMKKRRPTNVVIVALANKIARTIWAVLAHDRPYQKDYISAKPA